MTHRLRFPLLAALGVALAVGPAALAQGVPQIGYTDYELILVQMPEFREVQQQLQQQADADRQALAGLQTEIEGRLQEKSQELEGRLAAAQGPVTGEARQRQIDELRQEAVEFEVQQRTELEQAQQQRLQALGQREAELMQPLYDRLQEALNEVAEQRGLAVVLSSRLSGEPVILYAGAGAVDVTAEVMSALGISMQSSTRPAVGN